MTRRKPSNPATIYLSRWSKSHDTYITMRGALKRASQALDDEEDPEKYPWHKIDYAVARSLPALLQDEDLAPATVNKILVAVRGVLEISWRSGMLPDEEYRRIKIEAVRGRGDKAGHALSADEVAAFLAALEKASTRDAAVLGIMFACGLRRVEIVRMRTEDYNPQTGLVRAYGKGNKVRSVPVAPGWRPFVEKWWSTRAPKEWLFTDGEGGQWSRRGVSYVVENFYKAHGLKKFTAHDFRRSFSTGFLERGGDIGVLSRLLGHASVQTTIGSYDRRDDEGAKEILATMPGPKEPEETK